MANSEIPESPAAAPSLDVENGIVRKLTEKFTFLTDQVNVQRVRRLWATVPMSELHPVVIYAKDELGFNMMCTITGTDEGAELGLLYHLAHDNGVVLTLVTRAPKDGPGPDTITPYFPLAELYEREVIDLLGARIQGLPEGNRYPLPDAWPEGQYPLRKDWKPEGAKVETPDAKEKQG
jgi:membrane-bound hydrogenase subunit beta